MWFFLIHAVAAIELCRETYTFGREIQRDAKSIVYQAVQNQTDAPFAIKIVHDLTQARTEYENLNLLSENLAILKMFCYQEHDQQGFFLLERYSKLPKSMSNEDTIWRMLAQIANGLKALHQQNMIHRNLQFNAIAVTDAGFSFKLTDFRFEKTQLNPLIMSPEQLKHKSYDAKVDLWALGILLANLVTGRYPFSPVVNQSQRQVLKAIEQSFKRRNRYVIESMISTDLSDLIGDLLQPDPTKRLSFDRFFARVRH